MFILLIFLLCMVFPNNSYTVGAICPDPTLNNSNVYAKLERVIELLVIQLLLKFGKRG